MRLQRRVIYSFVFALFVFFASMFAQIVPCQTAPLIPNPTYSWSFCSLNPDAATTQGLSKMYLGYTESLSQGYFMVLLLAFLGAMIFLHFTAKTRKEK
jgi:hypothetical protein